MIGDEETGTAAVVDPQRDTDQYIAFAAEHALKIKHVFLTHLHADFVAGHLELRDRVGATIYLGAAAKAAYAFTPLHDGDILEFGRVRLKVLETPGHTPESISILVYDLNASDTQPHAVLTGDTLFIGDVGRPDLRAALGWSATELGGMLFDSLHTKLLALPDQSLVYPAHGAGSLCGKALSKETVSTLGEQRRSNYALQPMSKEAFIQVVTADQPDAPAYFNYDAVLNSEERPTLDQTLAREMNPLTLDDVLALQAAGAQILDTRDAGRICRGASGGQHQHRPRRPVRNVGRNRARSGASDRDHRGPRPGERIGDSPRAHRVRSRGRIFEGWIAQPGIAAGTDASRPSASARRSPRSFCHRAEPPLAIDVRAPREREQKHIAGSLGIPLNHLAENLEKLPKDRPLLVYCAGGYRSSIAASLLQRGGFDRVSEIAGGIAGWEAAKLPGSNRPAPRSVNSVVTQLDVVDQSPISPVDSIGRCNTI